MRDECLTRGQNFRRSLVPSQIHDFVRFLILSCLRITNFDKLHDTIHTFGTCNLKASIYMYMYMYMLDGK